MRIVLDTNVLVSGLINASGPPGRIVDLIQASSVALVADDRILQEYEQVLRRPRLAGYFARSAADAILDFLRSESQRVVSRIIVDDLADPADAPFLEVALTAEAPLVTGNVRHFPPPRRKGCEVLTPAEFVARLAADVDDGTHPANG